MPRLLLRLQITHLSRKTSLKPEELPVPEANCRNRTPNAIKVSDDTRVANGG